MDSRRALRTWRFRGARRVFGRGRARRPVRRAAARRSPRATSPTARACSGPGQAEALNAKLEQFEKDTSNQVLVWVDKKIPEGFTLDDFAVRAFKKWGVGQKGTNNGAALFVFTEDRKLRIEVGYGLEGALPGHHGQADHRRRDRSALSRAATTRAASTRARTP